MMTHLWAGDHTSEYGMKTSHFQTKKLKSQPTMGRMMLTVFQDSQGLILEHHQEWYMMIKSACHSGKLKLAIWSICCGQLSHVAAWHCPFSYCWNTLASMLLTSTIEPWSCSLWFSFEPLKHSETPLLCQQQWAGGGGACHPIKNILMKHQSKHTWKQD